MNMDSKASSSSSCGKNTYGMKTSSVGTCSYVANELAIMIKQFEDNPAMMESTNRRGEVLRSIREHFARTSHFMKDEILEVLGDEILEVLGEDGNTEEGSADCHHQKTAGRSNSPLHTRSIATAAAVSSDAILFSPSSTTTNLDAESLPPLASPSLHEEDDHDDEEYDEDSVGELQDIFSSAWTNRQRPSLSSSFGGSSFPPARSSQDDEGDDEMNDSMVSEVPNHCLVNLSESIHASKALLDMASSMHSIKSFGDDESEIVEDDDGFDESDPLHSPVISSPQQGYRPKLRLPREHQSPGTLNAGTILETLNPVMERSDRSMSWSNHSSQRWDASCGGCGIDRGSSHTISTRSASTSRLFNNDSMMVTMNDSVGSTDFPSPAISTRKEMMTRLPGPPITGAMWTTGNVVDTSPKLPRRYNSDADRH